MRGPARQISKTGVSFCATGNDPDAYARLMELLEDAGIKMRESMREIPN
jgi:hypothetical protein